MNKTEFFLKIKSLYHLNQIQENQLLTYLNLIIEINKVMDLTANITKEEILEKNFYDSILSLAEYDYHNKTLIDVGTGAGFPGLLYAIMCPYLKVTLVEPKRKRVEFLKLVKEKLNLNNVEIICSRIEDLIKISNNKFDFASARGVAKLNILLELIIPILKVNGIFIALKGKMALEEEKDAQNALTILNVKRVLIKEFNLPTNQEKRINLYYQKEKETSIKYPRKFAQIKNKPL